MTIGMTKRQGKRGKLLAMATMFGCVGSAANLAAADGPNVFNRQPSGPIFKTLDALAGGIEMVLEKTVLGHSKANRGSCDSQACDDGCDAIMLHELNLPRSSKIAVPEAYQPLSPSESLMDPVAVPSAPSMRQVDPTFDRPMRKTLPRPMPESTPSPGPRMDLPPVSRTQPPKPAASTLPRVPADAKTPVQRKAAQPDLSTDDAWIDSFAPATPNPDALPIRREPVPADDPLFDPFQDDPQTRTNPGRFLPDLKRSTPSHATGPIVRRAVKPVGFERSN